MPIFQRPTDGRRAVGGGVSARGLQLIHLDLKLDRKGSPCLVCHLSC